MLILLVDLRLDVLPVVVGEFLLVVEWIEISHLICDDCGSLSLDDLASLVDILGGHGGDAW